MKLSLTGQMNGSRFPKRGDIYWANLDPAIGSETKKLRPCLIISNNIGNEISSIVIIAPITSKVKNIYPFEIKITLKEKTAKIMLNQLRAIDKSRLGEKIFQLDSTTLGNVDNAIKIVLGLT